MILIRTEDGCKKMRESLVSFPIIIVVSTFVTIYVQYSIFAPPLLSTSSDLSFQSFQLVPGYRWARGVVACILEKDREV